jgi:hypothetical protein
LRILKGALRFQNAHLQRPLHVGDHHEPDRRLDPHETKFTVMYILTGVGILVSFLDFMAQRVADRK